MIFARSASRSGLPGTAIDGDIRDRAAVERAATGCDAICHCRGAREHLAAPAPGLRRRQRRRAAERPGRRRGAPHAARPLHIVVRRHPAARPHRAAARRTTTSARRSPPIGSPTTRSATGSPLVRVYPGVVYGPGLVHRRQSGRPADRRSSQAQAARTGRTGTSAGRIAYVDDVAAGHCAALERGRVGATLRAGRRKRAAAPALRDRAAAHRTPAAAAHPVSRRGCAGRR